ncbi:hypothetical protein MUN82_08640 [Hymenobacter aerilatus]|uniref:Uncharacterized protein n=1 Tax=Hymenobacter aerilatus TaxID=2932251 RepID=A0A8T9T3I2_9BACT|nr:hypothetical protein [Hymenobacter aerilatus]UOR07150.1 hypothetical protein MUN82_08640 [Hymenobacter aerilatus]
MSEADWRALGPNCQGIVRRLKGLVNTARSDAGIYANKKFQGYAVFIPNPYYVTLDTSGILLPRQPRPALNELGPPIVISQPGTYTISAGSGVSNKPAVEITAQNGLVDIIGGHVVSASDAFLNRGYCEVRIRNVFGWGLPPTVDGVTHGKAVNAFRPRLLTVENCQFQSFGTMILAQQPDDTARASTLTVSKTILYDIDGRFKNGTKPSEKSNGVQFDGQVSRPGMLIEDNFIQNHLPDTTAEDNFNIHNSSGTAASPAIVRNNIVDQSYGASGSGITTDGDKDKQANAATAAAFTEAYGNTFLGIRNGSLNNSGGHDNDYHDNVVVCANLLPDGSPRPASTYDYNAGASISNSTNAPASAFYNNRTRNNLLCVNHSYYHFAINGRHDLAGFDYGTQNQPWRTNIIPIDDNTYLVGDLPNGTASRAMETLWKNIHLQRWAQQGIKLGPLTNR